MVRVNRTADAAGFGGAPPALPKNIVAEDWRPLDPPRNTLGGFVSLRLPSGIVLRDCSLHVQGEKRWIGLPGRPQLDPEGRQRIDLVGKKLFAPTVEIPNPARRERFRKAALAAVDRLLGRDPP
jgi:hypothetical protein